MSCWCGAAGSILALAAALASPGCDNNKARPVPPGPAGLPPAAGNPAAAPDKAALTHAPTGGTTGELPAGHPAVGGAPTAMPADHPPTLQAAPPPAAESGRLEGALKLKEISYIHAEGYPAAEMKHGPIALIDEAMPVFVIATKGASYEKVVSNIQEVKARKGKIIAIVAEDNIPVEELLAHHRATSLDLAAMLLAR